MTWCMQFAVWLVHESLTWDPWWNVLPSKRHDTADTVAFDDRLAIMYME